MKLHSDLPVYKSTYDLLLGIFDFTKSFSKEYKYTVGESLKKETIDLLILIYRVNTIQDKGAVLQEAKERIEVIRLLIRLMKYLHQISLKNFVAINTIVEYVSKQLTGWHKSTQYIPDRVLNVTANRRVQIKSGNPLHE
jgi:GTPase Era involved in 16S rRNA processing